MPWAKHNRGVFGLQRLLFVTKLLRMAKGQPLPWRSRRTVAPVEAPFTTSFSTSV